MKRKYIFVAIIAIMAMCLLTGCGKNETENAVFTESTQNETTTETQKEENKETQSLENVDFEKAVQNQMAIPQEGEEIAIFHVKGFGEIKIKLFRDIAPKAVENFVTHAQNGYYNDVIFHRVINEFMIQGGDPTGTGYGGESIWGTGFAEELSYELVPYRGTLCMASSGTGTSSLGSQFFITQAHYDEMSAQYMESYNLPKGLIEQYKKYGGNILSLYTRYTVFGQVYEGMDIVDKIAAVKTGSVPVVIDGVEYPGRTQDDKPVDDVVIEKIEITTYKAN